MHSSAFTVVLKAITFKLSQTDARRDEYTLASALHIIRLLLAMENLKINQDRHIAIVSITSVISGPIYFPVNSACLFLTLNVTPCFLYLLTE